MGFPNSSAGKESACNAGDPGLTPGLGRFPGAGKGCFCCCCCCCIASVMSDSVWPHRCQPARLPIPGILQARTLVGCHFLLQCRKVKSESEVAQSCLTLATPWTAAYQAPPSMGFSRQMYWSGVPLPSPREGLPTPLFCPGEFHGLGSPWGRKESDVTLCLSLSLSVCLVSCTEVFLLYWKFLHTSVNADTIHLLRSSWNSVCVMFS